MRHLPSVQFRLSSLLLSTIIVAVCCAVGVADRSCQFNSAFSQEDGEARKRDDETSDNEKALAVYADAANFQTKGELQLAIDQWKKFLNDFPQDPMAPKAAHYLGVCYMQLPTPDYRAAGEAFAQALRTKKYSLREESLSNYGWCLYALATDPKNPQPDKLEFAIKAFNALLEEFPRSTLADRAMFYHGEALYAQGNAREAIAKYDQLLKSSLAENSSMRCDALYAKGVALEDLKQYDQAISTYQQMLSTCPDDPLAGAVRTQLAEVLILQTSFAEADKVLSEIIAEGGNAVPRALYRRAFVQTQLNRPDDAAALYDRLVNEYSESEYAAAAIMSAAQGYYLAGDFDSAKERFESVIEKGTNLSAATEAAHWLSVLAIRENAVARAEQIARQQIEKGIEGPYATTLRLDAAEAVAMQPGRENEALQEFEAILASSQDDPLLSRILYNAAFTALQLGEAEKARSFTQAYFDKVTNDPLLPDMEYITAEASLSIGNVDAAVEAYNRLFESVKPDNPQLTFWTLRAASANFAAGKFDTAIAILEEHFGTMQTASDKAEAYFLIGSAHLSAQRPNEAIEAFRSGMQADENWRRMDEMVFRLAAAHAAAEQFDQAVATWNSVISRFPQSKMSDQSRYQLALRAATEGKFDEAEKWYDELLSDTADPVLKPFALYGLGRLNMQQDNYAAAVDPLTELIDGFPRHGFYDDALLARGMTYRRLDNIPQAASDLQAFLALQPQGINLGNALFEMAIIHRQLGEQKAAIEKLSQIVKDLPGYPEIDKVRFELGELLGESGEGAASMEVFAELAERSPDSPFAADANYKIAQQQYAAKNWELAAKAYERSAGAAKDKDLLEKSLYRLGWSLYQQRKFDEAADAFKRQATECPDGTLSVDALMMVGECYFANRDYEMALSAYETARKVILERDGAGRKFSDPAEQQVRELVFLHGGQSAAQLKQWKEALGWYEQLRTRYQSSSYVSQVLYETGLAYRELGDEQEAFKFFTETANTFRDESSARARFMLGQIYFAQDKLTEAITEFKRVMYGYGAEKAPESIHDWQAKSGFEAARCSERLMQMNQGERRTQAFDLARKYYEFVIDNHATHPLAAKARERLEVLKRL